MMLGELLTIVTMLMMLMIINLKSVKRFHCIHPVQLYVFSCTSASAEVLVLTIVPLLQRFVRLVIVRLGMELIETEKREMETEVCLVCVRSVALIDEKTYLFINASYEETNMS